MKGKANLVREKKLSKYLRSSQGLVEKRSLGSEPLNGGQYISSKGVVKRQHFAEVRSVAVCLVY